MSKISLQPNASGTAVFALVAPDSNTNRTLTLPDESGSVLSDSSTIDSNNLQPDVYKQDNIVGTVSESNGVPTGAIIERGSNANGEFVKYADGTLICTRAFGAGNTTSISNFGIFSFSAEFAVNPVTSFSCRASTSGSPAPYCFYRPNPPTTTEYSPNVASSGTFTAFFMTAVGRWF